MQLSGRIPSWSILVIVGLMVALVVSPMAEAGGKRRPKPSPPATGWQMVFDDDFNGSALDERKWTTAFPWGRDRSNVGELQFYAPDAFTLDRGNLQIIAKPTPNGSHAYNSGLISSHTSFAPEFGRFEIRCKLPRGKGLWPAFWLLPLDTSWPPEIDVFEALGQETETVHLTAHWLEGGEHRQKGTEYTGPDFSRDYHTFAVEWTPESLVWFVDGVKRHQVSGQSPRGPMYVLANLAVGGDWPGAPDASTQFPAAFDIDYIRAYESAPAPAASESKAKKKHKHHGRKKHKRKRHRTGSGSRETDT
jgi:beta-glucanase (GH16 family)